MHRYFFLSLLLLFVVGKDLQAQEVFIHAWVNSFIPMGNTEKQMFPLVHYSKDADRKLALGGLALGVSYWRHYTEKLSLKGQVNLMRYAHWDEALQLRDESNTPFGAINFFSVNYSAGLSGLAHFYLSKRFSVGSGVGLQVLLASNTRARDGAVFGMEMTTPNKQYKMFMPLVPIEFSLKYDKMLYAVRYEQALLNRYRGDLAKAKSESFGLISFEIARRIH